MDVAVIGAGRWGRNLVRNLAELGALRCVADKAAEARAALEPLGLDLLHDHSAAIRSSARAVAIATPSPSHFAIACEALSAGKDVFVEKPMALCASEALALVELARRQQRVLMVGHLVLFQPAVAWLRDAIARGLIGRLLRLHHERLQFGRARATENALWNLGVHDVAVALDLARERPVRVQCHGLSDAPGAPADDVRLELAFPGDLTVHVHASWRWPERRRRLTAIGTEGMLVYDELEQTVTLHRKRIARAATVATDDDLSCHDEGAEVVFRGEGEPVRRELEHFLECVRLRTEPRASGAEGLAVVEVLERAERSMAAVARRA